MTWYLLIQIAIAVCAVLLVSAARYISGQLNDFQEVMKRNFDGLEKPLDEIKEELSDLNKTVSEAVHRLNLEDGHMVAYTAPDGSVKYLNSKRDK